MKSKSSEVSDNPARWRKILRTENPWIVLFPVVLGFTLRLLALHSLKQTPYFDFLLWDERIYHDWAVKIAEGTFSSEAVYEFSPLPAYLTALIYRLFSPDVVYVRYMNILFGTGICALVYGIGRRIGGGGVGLVAGLLAAVYELLVFYSIVPLKATLGVFLFALTVLLFLYCLERAEWKHLLFLGAAFGLLLNVRPNALVMLPAFPLILLWVHREQRWTAKKALVIVGLFLAGFGIAVSPFVIRNLKAADRFALTTSQAGFNLYLGNHLHSLDPYYRPVPFAVTSPFAQGVQFTIEASRRAGNRLTAEEASDYWTKEVLRIASEQPGAFSAKMLRKSLVWFNRFEAGDHYDIGFLQREAGFMNVFLPGLALVFPLGFAGLILAVFKKSKPAASLLVLFLLYAATLMIFFTNARYRLPLLIILIPYAALLLVEVVQNFSPDASRARPPKLINGETRSFPSRNNESAEKKLHRIARKLRPLLPVFALVAAGTALELLPVRGTADTTAYYNTHAIVLNAAGRTEEAVRYWKASSQMEGGFSDFANLSLAGYSASAGRVWEARQWLEKISSGSYAEAQKLVFLGDLDVRERRFGAAAEFYRKALSVNSGLLMPRSRLIGLFEAFNPALAAPEREKKEYIESFYREARGNR
ncbi:MAG: glycosyltransferase family 39 protein [Desulfobacterales bacterium]|nr:glycosyltransferase family 39 protein [Desulfobacterales bacterium]